MKNDWQTKRLGEVCEIIKGRKPLLKAIASNGDLPYLVAKVMRGSAEAEFASVKDRNSVTVDESETIIICDGSNSGEVFTGFRGVLSSTMGKISKKTEIDDDYLRAFLASTFEIFNGAKTGAAIPHLDKDAMYDLEFPLPPLPEQQRIVGILDEAFEGIATAKANAEKNLQNARALFESHLQSVFTQRGKGWVETKLDDVTDLITCGVAKRPNYVPVGIPFLSAKNVKNGQVVWNGYQYVSEEAHRALTKNNKPKLGDILYTRVGSYGEAAIIDRDIEFSIFVSLTLIKPKPVVLNSFLKYYLNSSAVKELAAGSITGSGVGNLNVGTVREFPIYLPPLSEQRSIVTKLDDLREKTQRLESVYQRKLAALEALKKSLLHQAFSGNL